MLTLDKIYHAKFILKTGRPQNRSDRSTPGCAPARTFI